MARDGELLGAVYYTNPLRQESATAIKALYELGISCYLLTGDNSKAANAVAYKLNIKPGNTYAEVFLKKKGRGAGQAAPKAPGGCLCRGRYHDVPAMATADVAVSFAMPATRPVQPPMWSCSTTTS